MQSVTDAAGNAVPAWKVFWPLFGASNQLLAALTLIGLTVWLSRAYQARWVWWVLGAPTLWMYTMSLWALLRFIKAGFFTPAGEWKGISWDPVTWVAVILVALAALLLVEAFRIFFPTRRRPAPNAVGEPAG
jgi:carbon starvation protein